MRPTPFEVELKRLLLSDARKAVPNHDVVGALIGAAIAVTLEAGRNPREDLLGVLEKSLTIVFGDGRQRPS